MSSVLLSVMRLDFHFESFALQPGKFDKVEIHDIITDGNKAVIEHSLTFRMNGVPTPITQVRKWPL